MRQGRRATSGLAEELRLEIDALSVDLDLVLANPLTADADPAELAARRKAEAALKAAVRVRDDAGASGRQQSIASILQQGRSSLDELMVRRQELRDAEAVIGEFRDQLAALPVDTGAATPDPAVLAEYRKAEAALERAVEAARGLERERLKRVLGAVGTGRVAVLRLEALLAGRPVPLELITPEELAKSEWDLRPGLTPDRFYYEGRGPAEIVIDRPVPGKAALLDLVCEGADYKKLALITRSGAKTTEERFFSDSDPYRGRELVPAERTHVRIETEPKCQWSLRFRPLRDARPLTGSLRGQGPEVLLCPESGSLRLTAHLRQPGENGEVRFVDESDVEGGVEIDWSGDAGRMVAHGLGTFRRTESVDGPGLLVVRTPGTWELKLARS
ncbi:MULTISPECIES: hypothetical protein [Kitasatospora]|uniref:hypothetical protein n=1 Tax=Kitasatospora TaxID=2063 RepID=UPI0031D3B31B